MKYEIKEIKNFLIDKMKDLKEQNINVYWCYLADTISQSINYNKQCNAPTSEAIKFIKDNFNFISDVVNYYKDNLSIDINPFLEPDKGEVLSYMCGVENLINQSEVLRQADEQVESGELTLTDEIIDKFIEELDSLEIEL